MRFLLSFFLSIQIISNSTFLEDVLRIPLLVEHYKHHTQTENPNLSFLGFIKMHYLNGSDHQDINHSSLPLHHSHDVGHIHVSSIYTLPEEINIFLKISLISEQHSTYTSFIPDRNTERIFQPPKIC